MEIIKLFKHLKIVTLMVIVITLSLAQVYVLNTPMMLNSIGTVDAASISLPQVYLFADSAVSGGNGSAFAITDSFGHYTMTTGLLDGTYNVTAFAFGYIQETLPFVNVVAALDVHPLKP